MENRYDKYKDSGVEWIGEIPEHWKITKIQYLAQLKSGYSLTTEEITDNGLYPVYGGNGIRGYYDKYFLEGDYVLIGRQGALCGNINYSTNKSWATEHAVVCYPKIKYVTRWFGELLRVMNLNQYSLAAAQPGLAVERIKLLPIPIIPLPEQQSIAAYLDQKCGEIDELITLQEEMITKLQSYKQSVITEAVTKGLNKIVPLKDSGIEWIGEIPKHWEASKTLFVLSMSITDGPHTTPELFETGIPFVSAEAVSFGNGRIDFSHIRGYISEIFYQECCKKYIPQIDDIYMIKSGATTGRVAIVDADIKFTIWSPLAVFRCNKERMLPRFLFYQLQSNGYQKQIELNWSYGTQQNIGMRTLEKLILSVPPLPEQYSIADYLDKKCSEIDKLISIKQQKIEKLKEYKKSLIFECVTGKRKVS